jgi:hypothetical protein
MMQITFEYENEVKTQEIYPAMYEDWCKAMKCFFGGDLKIIYTKTI